MESGSNQGLGRGDTGYRSQLSEGERRISRDAANTSSHPSSGAGSGSQRAFCHPDRWSWSAQLGPTKSRKRYSNPLLCIRAAWVSHTGTTPELRILPHSNPCVLQHILQTPSLCPSDSQRPPPCTYPIRSTGKRSRSWPPAREGAPVSWRRQCLKGHLGQRGLGLGSVCSEFKRGTGSRKNVFTRVRRGGPEALVSFSPRNHAFWRGSCGKLSRQQHHLADYISQKAMWERD